MDIDVVDSGLVGQKKTFRVVAAATLVFAAAVVSIVLIALPSRREDVWVDLANACIQLVVVVAVGAVIGFVVRGVDAERQQRQLRVTQQLDVASKLIAAYQQLKYVRRHLRAVGIRDGPDTLRNEQVAALRADLEKILIIDSDIEQIERELAANQLFDDQQAMTDLLDGLRQYLRGFVQEWELHGPDFWETDQTGKVRDLVTLQGFLGDAKADFIPRAAKPLRDLQALVSGHAPDDTAVASSDADHD